MDMTLTKNRKYHLLDCVLLVCAIAAVYGRLIGYDFQTHWDDNGYILNNPASRGFSWDNIRTAFSIGAGRIGQYNPLSLLSFMLDFTLWGQNPGGYHLTNIVVHGLNGLLVYHLLFRLYGSRLISLITSALFLLHPVQVESVAWISERKGLLSLFFMLISWECYLGYLKAEKGSGRLSYILSLTAFVLSLLAKTASVVFPLILLVFDRCFTQRALRNTVKDKIPFFVVSALFSAIEVFSEMPENGGALIGYHGGSPLATFYTMLPVFCRYLRLLVWPAGLNVEHLPPIHTTPDAAVLAAAVLLACVAFLGYRLYRQDRRLGFWVIFFWIGLLPVSQIVPLILMMYEHYLYMPIIGAAVLVASGVDRLREQGGPKYARILYLLLFLWLLALSLTSYQRTAVWENSITLFSDATSKSPGGARVWEVLGEAHYFFGNKETSRRALEKSLALNPKSTDVLWALGEVNAEMGEYDKGLDYLNRLLAINPNYARGWATLGNIHKYRGEYAQSKEMYQKALAIQPDAVQVQMLLGKLAIRERKPEEARIYLNRVEADKRGWNLVENAYLMACVESLAGRTDEAFAWLEKALQRGYSDYYTLNTNQELSGIWDNPRFNYLMLSYFPEHFKER
jgi:tetratricopeptide (TPR) repeat protein